MRRLEPRLGRNKAIARKLLVAVWHVLAEQATDHFAQPEIVAHKLMQFTYKIGKRNRPADQSTAHFVRTQLDQLQLGAELSEIPWGTKKKPIPLPPSTALKNKVSDVPNT